MITFAGNTGISSIYLTVTLIIYLMIIELGNEKMKRMLMPAAVVLMVSFVIIAVESVYSQLIR